MAPELQATFLWRAALADQEGSLARGLTHPIVATACRIADQTLPVAESLRRFESQLREIPAAGLFVDVSRRALARASVSEGNAQTFARELFAGFAAYLTARDLPSYVGKENRIATVRSSMELKNQIAEVTRARVTESGAPDYSNQQSWSSYVADVSESLRGTGT